MGVEEVSSGSFSSDCAVNNAELNDTDLVFTIRKALASVQNGDTDQYDQLIQLMYIKKESDGVEVSDDVDVMAQREVCRLFPHMTIQTLFYFGCYLANQDMFTLSFTLRTLLKILARSVACLDEVHHKRLLELILGTRIWDYKSNVNVMYAFLDLIVSLATTNGKYLIYCLDMLISNLRSQPRILNDKMLEVVSRVHAALGKISYLVPLAPSKLLPILVQRMPSICAKDHLQVVVPYVENLFKLENSSIGKVYGNVIFNVVVERLRDLDLLIGWDDNDILQDDSSIAMFDMELDVAVEGSMNEGEEFPVPSLDQKRNVVSKLLDDLMELSSNHLEACQDAGRLDEVFEYMFESFEIFILNTQNTKFSQFLMLYACSLDPENCGVKFASKLLDIFLSNNKYQLTRTNAVDYLASYLYRAKFLPASFVASMLKRLVDESADYCRTCNDDAGPEAHQVFYSGCQAILYVLCFRMRSILDVPGFRSQLTPLESVLSHKLDPLKMCHPLVVSEFRKEAKAAGLFIVVSEAFILNGLPKSELSRERLILSFPFDRCLLKISKSIVNANPYLLIGDDDDDDDNDDDDDDDELLPEVTVYEGDTDSEEDCDDDVVLNNEVNKMSITLKHSFMCETERLLKMPSRIRPSSSPCESL